MRIAMGVSCGYPALLSLLWTISYAETYHGTPEGDMNFQTELVGESSCAIETNHDRGSSPWGDVASALVEGLGADRAPDFQTSGGGIHAPRHRAESRRQNMTPATSVD